MVTRTLSLFATLFFISDIRSSIWPFVGLIEITGSISPVGLIICSAICILTLYSNGPGVAEVKITLFNLARNSSNLKGLLSSAEGSLNPKSTRVCFLDLSPSYMPRTCGTEMWDSSIIVRKSSGKKSISVFGVSPGVFPRICLE